MKRIIALILAALFVVAMLASCGVKGKYVIYMVDGEKVDKDDRDDYPTIELKKGGEYVAKYNGKTVAKGDWEKDGKTITFDGYGEATYKGGKLYFDDGDTVYKKK